MLQAQKDDSFVLIESTSNQVDQYGGYTGMTPAKFVTFIRNIAEKIDFPFHHVVLGGDHLGPNAWQAEKSDVAMDKAKELIKVYVLAGFNKIHLDTSMRCTDDLPDDHGRLNPKVAAERAAELCRVAEDAFAERNAHDPQPLYVIGTEVPTPGGAIEKLTDLQPTAVSDAEMTVELTRKAFARRGLEIAWERVIAMVVQPGVEFGDSTIIEYVHDKALDLIRFIENRDNMVYEAHSTDFQSAEALRQLVEDHFAVLKVGPWLTFAFREAVFALAVMEEEWLGQRQIQSSGIRDVIQKVMLENPKYWQKHYKGTEAEQEFARKYSYSDRMRYYWSNKKIITALNRLVQNLTEHPLPLTILSQFLPNQYHAVREGWIKNLPLELIRHKIMEVTAVYAQATQINRRETVLV